MTAATATIAADQRGARAGLTVGIVAAGLLGLFAADNILLLHFLGLSLSLTAGLVVAAGVAIGVCCRKSLANLPPVSFRVLGGAFLFSLALFVLGGEGGFFYANTDWQIRDAVLRDLATNPWPFAYDVDGTAYQLRAPLGTYLLPAMFGTHADVALLISNALRLSLLLTLAWHLFESRRERTIGLAVFMLFSGWDLVGTAFYWIVGANPFWDHIEPWNIGYQYSSHVTQAFWVPHHAIAGWTCAVAFLLWRKGLAPVGMFAASIPLVAIWSPLAIMGAVPFALFAGLDVLRRRAFGLNDIAITMLAVAISLPSLLYMQIDAGSVGMHFLKTSPLVWMLCIFLEVLPFAWPLLRAQETTDTDRPVVRLILLLLLLMPLVQIGATADFQMRASIMPLALLAVLFAKWLCKILSEEPQRRPAITYAVVAIALGAVTPMLELRRAVMNAPSPPPHCSLVGVWHKQDNMIVPYATYLAPVAKLPSFLRNVPVTAGGSDPATCWDRKWVSANHG